uniref:PiggyBac transposable element-derived protein domain-containing protein n=1 Tax=Latimeria chalumnae TaxID=7897 RepID=H3AE94_LATCH
EMRAFLVVLLINGYAVMPRRRMMWEQREDVYNAAVSQLMKRDRFKEILRYLHLVDNSRLPAGDKLGKIRPFCDMVEKNLCVDEAMIPYYGKHSAKQFMNGKTIRFGYKLWCLNTQHGYLLQYEAYASKGVTLPELGLGGSVVTRLFSALPQNVTFQMTFDNLFTSLPLLQYLGDKGIGATGTLRANRVQDCPVLDTKSVCKKPRGSVDYRYGSTNKWNDNSMVTMASNCQPVMPIGKAKHYSQAKKMMIEVDELHVIRYCSKYMGGVDKMEQNISYYRIFIRSKKWWVPFFMFMPDVAIQNAWLLYRNPAGSKNRPQDLLAFQREMVNVYRLRYSAEVQNVPGISHPLKAGHQRKEKVPKGTNGTQRRCAHCSKKAKFVCCKCDVGLHIDCFKSFHQQ